MVPLHRYVKVRGVLMHYLEWPGEGQPLLLVHGLMAHAGIWRHIAKSLQGPQRRRLVALDLRGHGDSEKPPTGYLLDDYTADVAAFVQQLGLQKPILLGLSLGGRIGLQMAGRHPDMLGGVAVGDIGADFTAAQVDALSQRMQTFPFVAADRAQMRADFAERYPTLPAPAADLWFDEGVSFGADGGLIWKAPRHAILETVARWNETNPAAEFERIHCPMLILKGGASGTCTDDQARFLVDKIPGARLQVLPGLGHHISLEGPGAYLDAIADLLA